MKKVLIALFVILCVLMSAFAGGGRDSTATADGPFPGKIAIVTLNLDQNEEEFRSAEALVRKYGENKITHVTWPSNFMAEQEQMITILTRIAADMEVRGLVMNVAVTGSNAAVDRFRSLRDDVFIVYCGPHENPVDVARRANLVLDTDHRAIGTLFIDQAAAMGARTVVHYSFPRHMSLPLLSARRDTMRARSAELGIQFVDANAPDPTGDGGVTGTQQFILEDVPRILSQYGNQTAVFGTNCSMQTPMLVQVIAGRAIYPMPCCPSPYHAFPIALGIQTPVAGQGLADMGFVINETRRIATENGMAGRLANWPVPIIMMYTTVGAEYAIKWINGEAPRTGVDQNLVLRLMNEYILEMSGSVTPVSVVPHAEGGQTFPHYLLTQMGFLVY